MTENCRNAPTATGQGRRTISAKSDGASFMPMPNMITWMSGTISRATRKPRISVNGAGNANAVAAQAMIRIENRCWRTNALMSLPCFFARSPDRHGSPP